MPSRRWSPPHEIGKMANPSSSANSINSPNSDDNSTIPIADLVREAPTTMPLSNGRCIYFPPPSAAPAVLPNRQSPHKGLRRFLFFGDSPQPPAFQLPQPTNRRSFAPNSSSSLPLDEDPSFASPLAQNRPSATSRGCAFLGAKQRHQNSLNFPLLLGSHSSRTVSVDFDSESTGTTVPTEEILPRKNSSQQQRNKCDANKKLHHQNGAFRHSQHQMPIDSPPSADGGHHQHRRATGPPLNFGGGSQFDAQSLQARRSRSFAATHSHHQQMSSYPNGSIGGTPFHHQQHNSMPMRCGSCSNLSLAPAGLNGGGGQLVLYEGGGQIGQQQQETMSTQRHSMILPMDVGQLSAPIWYQPIPPPPPPPFYYTAATLPHPGTAPLDYKSFKYALKESERLEKKQRKIIMAEFGEGTFGGACCEFCCGGSALILWLVVSLVALGFIGFLLMAIYFV